MSDYLVKRLRSGDTGHQTWLGLCEDAADRIEALEAAIKRQAGAARTLRAHTLAEVQHLKETDRSEYNAAKSLDSEREANEILTAEVEALATHLAQRDAALKAAADMLILALSWYADQSAIMAKPTIDAKWASNRLRDDKGATGRHTIAAYRKARGQDETAKG